jgi:hypothetical protein
MPMPRLESPDILVKRDNGCCSRAGRIDSRRLNWQNRASGDASEYDCSSVTIDQRDIAIAADVNRPAGAVGQIGAVARCDCEADGCGVCCGLLTHELCIRLLDTILQGKLVYRL